MIGITGDFGQLYRDALAERDPDRKLSLLHQVQEELDRWNQKSLDAGASTKSLLVLGPMHITRARTMRGAA